MTPMLNIFRNSPPPLLKNDSKLAKTMQSVTGQKAKHWVRVVDVSNL